jgi:hypothetical protein
MSTLQSVLQISFLNASNLAISKKIYNSIICSEYVTEAQRDKDSLPLSVRDEHGLGVFQNRVLRRHLEL